MKETDLAQPVANWMEERGYTVYSEIPPGIRGGCIDMVGLKNGKLLAVELKINLTKNVIYQANSAGLCCHEAYAAVSTKPQIKSIEKCGKIGIGLLSVKNNSVDVVINAAPRYPPMDIYVKKMLEQLKQIDPGVYAGKPCEKGIGPAQDCLKRIKAYLKEHPTASWKEIYKNVNNHYASYNSMQSSMRNWCHFRKPKCRRS